MVADSLIDGHVSSKQVLKAFNALHAYATKKQAERDANELLPGRDEHVWLVVGTKVMHPEKKLKPHRIPLKHPLVDPRETRICLITKDPQREYKDLLSTNNINFVSRVVGITKLKGKFRGFDARRALLEENGLFLADDRVVPLLPRLLGAKFFNAKKQPIPVSLTSKQLKYELERAVSSTYFHQNKGTCTSVKLGALSESFPANKLLDNFAEALPAIVEAVKGGWDNIQSLNIKTSSSSSLPVWTCDLGDGKGARWDGLTVETEEKSNKRPLSDDDSDDDDADEEPKKTKSSSAPKPPKVPDADTDAPPKKKRKQAVETDAPVSKKSKGADDVSSKASTPAKPKSDATPSKAKIDTPASKSKAESATPKTKAAAAQPKMDAKAKVEATPSKSKVEATASKPKAEATPSKSKVEATATPAKKEKKSTDTPSEKHKAAATPKVKSTPASDKPKSTPSAASPAPLKPALKSALKSSSSSVSPAVAKHPTFDVTATDLKAKKSAAAGGVTSKKDKIIASNAKGKEKKKALVGKEKHR